MHMWNEPEMQVYLAELQEKKLYERSDFWRIKEWNRTHLADTMPFEPWCFGLPDWQHDEYGRLCTPEYLFGLDPDRKPYARPEGFPGIDPDAREKQRYRFDPDWDNLESGISRRVDDGIRNDYWRSFGFWNGDEDHWCDHYRVPPRRS